MAKITLSDLMQKTRELSDQVNSRFISDDELKGYINFAANRLYDILIDAFEDYYYKEVELSATDGVIALPTDFYKLRGVDYNLGNGDYCALTTYTFNERNRNTNSIYRSIHGVDLRYRLMGDNLILTPKDGSSGTYKVIYIPQISLVNNSDTFDGFNGYEDFIVIDASIKIKSKEESEVQELVIMKQEIMQSIEKAKKNRDIGEPKKVRDKTHSIAGEQWL